MAEIDDLTAARADPPAPVADRGVAGPAPAPVTRDSPGDPAPQPGTPTTAPLPRLTRRGRVRKWDRPPHPKDWRWWVGNVGKTLIAIGLLLFGFVAYQLWGTGLETARAQRSLENEFDELLAAAPPITAPLVTTGATGDPETGEIETGEIEDVDTGVTPVTTVAADEDLLQEPEPDVVEAAPVTTAAPVPVAAQNIPEVENGDAIARLEIPAIGVSDIVVAGVKTSDLKKGPGHFPDTPLPGQLGNSAIAGHRTTYGQPFHNVDKLAPGDEIIVTTLSGRFVYRVTGQAIVAPSDYHVVSTTDPTTATLTLTSCHPKWTARQRIVIFSELDAEASGPVGEPVLNYGRPDEPADEEVVAEELPGEELGEDGAEVTESADPVATSSADGSATGTLVDREPEAANVNDLTSAETSAGIADAFAEGWFSDPNANAHVGFWGALLALIGVGSYLISRRFKRDWVGGSIGFVPFVVTLFFFFQNVNRLLPPNL